MSKGKKSKNKGAANSRLKNAIRNAGKKKGRKGGRRSRGMGASYGNIVAGTAILTATRVVGGIAAKKFGLSAKVADMTKGSPMLAKFNDTVEAAANGAAAFGLTKFGPLKRYNQTVKNLAIASVAYEASKAVAEIISDKVASIGTPAAVPPKGFDDGAPDTGLFDLGGLDDDLVREVAGPDISGSLEPASLAGMDGNDEDIEDIADSLSSAAA